MQTTDSGGRRYILEGKEVSEADYKKAKAKKTPTPQSKTQE